jgi:DNA-binding CsgD family transcriptional regulator
MRSSRPIDLTEDERGFLQTVVHRGKASARIQARARILLKAAEGWSDAEIARALDVGAGTVSNVRKRLVAGRREAVLEDQRQVRYRQALAGEQWAHLIAIACTPAPEGRSHWTLRLLAGKAVELGYVPKISPETIRQALKKTR